MYIDGKLVNDGKHGAPYFSSRLLFVRYYRRVLRFASGTSAQLFMSEIYESAQFFQRSIAKKKKASGRRSNFQSLKQEETEQADEATRGNGHWSISFQIEKAGQSSLRFGKKEPSLKMFFEFPRQVEALLIKCFSGANIL